MPSGKETIVIQARQETVWDFVKDLDCFAPLIPGYTAHEVINEYEGTWEFVGDFGFMKKKIKMKVDHIVRIEPSSITFDLKGLNESVEGEAKFEVEAIDGKSSRLTGFMEMSGGGFMAGMINGVLKSFVPESTETLVKAIGQQAERNNQKV
ncbi:MAG: CoxG family protein [Bacillus sp. (in: firmicutes)]